MSMSLRQVRGPVGSSVTLGVMRTGLKKPVEVKLTRKRVVGAIPVARPLLSIYSRGGEWIAWTEEGYYACSADGERLMSWQVQESFTTAPRLLPLQQFRPTFYRPDVIGRVLFEGSVSTALEKADKERGKKDSKVAEVAAALPPNVTLLEVIRNGKNQVARAEVTSQSDDPIGEVLLVLDGRALNAKPEIKRGKGPTEYTWTFQPSAGRHTVQVITRGKTDGSSGKPIEIEQAGKQVKSKLHVGIVWIAKHPIAGYSVETRPKMPDDIIANLRKNSQLLYDPGETIVLRERKGESKKAIVRMLDALKTKASDDYVTVVYFVGHSVPHKRDAYLVPHDDDLTDLPNSALSYPEYMR